MTPADAKTVVSSWIQECKLRRGEVGWDPYPISLRLGNWIKYFLCAHRQVVLDDSEFEHTLLTSMAAQTKWLLARLEFHLMANHLFENAVALCLVGLFFDGPVARKARRRGWHILRTQLPEQVLCDGGFFERSALYHSRILYCLADLYNIVNGSNAYTIEPYLIKMRSWLMHHSHPDGQIVLFNDAATNTYLSPNRLLTYTGLVLAFKGSLLEDQVQADKPFAFPSTGYYGWLGSNGTYLVCDAAPIGPDYQPGHAHADIFGFELSIHGQRVIVDAGTFDYQPGPDRKFRRSTAAHNTVELDGHDQSEMWSAFRVARRGRPQDVQFVASRDGFQLSGWHDGYQRLPGKPRHERHFHWDRKGFLYIRDRVSSKRSHRIVNRLHFHPKCTVTPLDSESFEISWSGGSVTLRATGYEKLTIESYDYSPEFGRQFPASCICLMTNGSNKLLEIHLRICELNDGGTENPGSYHQFG